VTSNIQTLAGTHHVIVASLFVVLVDPLPLRAVPIRGLARQPAEVPSVSSHLSCRGPRVGIDKQSKRVGEYCAVLFDGGQLVKVLDGTFEGLNA
jgi:hypothetical protein